MGIVDILLIILILLAIILCVYSFTVLRRMNKLMDKADLEINSVKEKVYPLFDDISNIVERANKISGKAESYINIVEDQFNSVQNKISKIKDFSYRNKPENRIQELVRNLTAIKKGISAFWEKFSN